jgi:hypothetical protein
MTRVSISGETTRWDSLTKKRVIIANTSDPKDGKSRTAIVNHFRHIASAFKKGDFDMPMFIHDRVPPGVPRMKKHAAEIDYHAEETETGARVVVTTKNEDALAAIHEFLKFQIEDHRTGDSTSVQP